MAWCNEKIVLAIGDTRCVSKYLFEMMSMICSKHCGLYCLDKMYTLWVVVYVYNRYERFFSSYIIQMFTHFLKGKKLISCSDIFISAQVNIRWCLNDLNKWLDLH